MKLPITIYLLITVFIVGFIYIIWKRIKKPIVKEYFDTNNTNLNLIFLKPVDAYKIIEESNYFNHFNKINMKARLCANLTDCKLKYKKELMQIDMMEEQAMTWLMDSMVKMIENIKPSLASGIKYINIKFAKTSSKLEGDMPHTHKNVIFIPSYIWNKIWQGHQQYLTYKTENIIKESIREYGSTLMHELFHILQRQFQNKFEKFYQEQWNFIKFDRLDQIDKISNVIDRNRLNPDGIDVKWIWKNPYNLIRKEPEEYYIILATFRNDNPNFLTDVDNNIYLLEKVVDTHHDYVIVNGSLLDQHQDFQNYFGIKNNNYHPNEISAEYMSIYLLKILKIFDKIDINTESEGYIKFTNWLEDFLAW